MSVAYIIFIVISGVTLLLFLILKAKISAFISLLLASVFVGVLAGMPLSAITASIQNGMGGTLGFVATVVGLGAIFGQMLESSGGAESLARYLVKKFGREKSSWAMVLTGFLVAIPVFLDVGLIILIPVVYALSRDTKRSLLYYGIPLLAGLAVAHSFIPPTPGPIAVADIIHADIGWVIIFGIILGLPTAIIAGPVFGKYISAKIHINPPSDLSVTHNGFSRSEKDMPSFQLVFFLIAIPLILILIGTFMNFGVSRMFFTESFITRILVFLGHPFTALIIATLLAIWLLCVRRGVHKQKILELSTKALGPAGIIILITGAGGVLKQILIDSGIGKIIAESIAGSSMPVILLAWVIAALVRITQGSATVAMITAAGIISPVLQVLNPDQPDLALIVIAIASGATILSHVNDSGFWLVNKYFGMDEKQTLRSWTVMETIIAFCGLGFTLLASIFI